MKRVSLTPAVFHISDRVNKIAETYGEQPIVPRGPALKPIMDRVRSKVVTELGAVDTHEAIILTASGSGAIAATVGSCVSEKGILVIANDTYGERQASFCQQLGIKTIVYKLDYAEYPEPTEVERLVKENDLGTIGMVHGCTSIGMLNPVKEIGTVAKKLGVRLIVDAIASVFVEEININNWNIDALICSTNKGLHSNPDLSFAVVSKNYLEEMKERTGRIPYLDLYQTFSNQINGSHPYTINIRAMLEFEAALDDFQDRGSLAGRIKMYQDRTKILRDGYKRIGLKVFQNKRMELQNIGTALYLPEGIGYAELAQELADWNNGDDECYEIYSAQGKLSSKLFRVFNMGEYSLETYERFINALETTIKKLSA